VSHNETSANDTLELWLSVLRGEHNTSDEATSLLPVVQTACADIGTVGPVA